MLEDAARDWGKRFGQAVGTRDEVAMAELLAELTPALRIFGGSLHTLRVNRGYSDESDTARAAVKVSESARLIDSSRE